MVSYRMLSSEEMPTAVRLWVEVFEVEAPFFQTLLAGGDDDDFSLGAFDNGHLVSSVHVFMRWFTDLDGKPMKVGGIGSVSTLPEARSKGHSSKLLLMAIAEMERRDCVWSYLGTGVNDHYAKHGWRTLSTPYFHGTLKPASPNKPIESRTVGDSLLTQMAEVHKQYFKHRPMANVRSEPLWMHSVRYRTTTPGLEVFAAGDDSGVGCYLVSKLSDDSVELVEAACKDGFEARLKDLVSRRLAMASLGDIKKAFFHLAEKTEGFSAFHEACSEVWAGEERGWMGRPIAERISWPTLAAIHADPRGRRSELDHF